MLAKVLMMALVGLSRGCTESETKGSCAWSPISTYRNDFCFSTLGQKSQEPVQGQDENISARNSATANETTWEGPKHCVGEYCVYFHRQFAGGIVVITKRENAKRIAELPDLVLARRGLPSFYATEVPGKGVGLVANRTIKSGEKIMLWQPTFIIHRRLTDDMPPDDLRYILDAALLKLPASRKRAFLQQLGQFGGHRVSDVLLTNAFQMIIGSEDEDGHHLGNFPDVSRFNHDCRPNVAFRIDKQAAHHTYAVREIAVGEELTLSYMNPFETHEVRQRHIFESWGFHCSCPACSMSEEEIRASDARLHEIDELVAVLESFPNPGVSVKMVERLLELYEKERLEAKLHGAHVIAALNYNLLGDAHNAKRYAQLAVTSGVIEFGPDAYDVKAMQELARDPKQHFTWRKRLP